MLRPSDMVLSVKIVRYRHPAARQIRCLNLQARAPAQSPSIQADLTNRFLPIFDANKELAPRVVF
jgi:hypothetical protein